MMTAEQRVAYREGHEAAELFARIHPEQAADLAGLPADHLFTPDGGALLRTAVDNVRRLEGLTAGGAAFTPESRQLLADLLTRYSNLKDHVRVHGENGPKTDALVSALEATGDAARATALCAGVPGDDLCADEPVPEDEFFARGFVAGLQKPAGPQ